MKQSACMLAAVMAWTTLQAADNTNAPPREAVAPTGAVLASHPKDSASEALGLGRIRDTLARRPAGDGGDTARDWLTAVVIRCEQFLDEQPHSAHAAEVRAVDAQHRLELAALTNDRAEHDKAVQVARQALPKNERGPGAARARLVLACAAWPEDLATVIDQTQLIARDCPDQPLAAEALWWLARAQQRKGDERAVRDAAISLFALFPKSPEAAQARMLLRQLGLAGRPAPSLRLKTADGQSFDFDDFHGQAVLLDFWTAATLPASESRGVLRQLFETHQGGLSVIGINLDTDRATFDQANAAHPTPWSQVFAGDPANAKLPEAYPALVAPTRLLLDPSGMVARLAAHPAEIVPLLKQWQSTSAAAAAGAKPPPVAVAKPPPTATEKRKVAGSKPTPKPMVTTPVEKQAIAPPPMPAPRPTHIEIGGVLYAKPLSPAPNAIQVESTQPPAKPSPAATKPFASTEKPLKPSRPDVAASVKADSAAARPPSTPPLKPRPGYGTTSGKPALKSASAESLATLPDISEADRKAVLMIAAKRILKSEEELVSWSEMEALFTTRKPASIEGALAWYQDVADRCQQFIKDYPNSAHVNLMRINEARCRLSMFKATQDTTQRSRAEAIAHEVLGHKPNEDDAIRAEFLLLNATWPDYPEQGVAIAKRIVKDFPHRPETAAAMLMHAQFRRRQAMLHAAKEAAADLLKQFPDSGFAFNARSLIKQCDLLNNPCPPLKLTGLHGEKMDSVARKGKPLLIEFWSPNSKNALENAAKLVQLYLRYQPKGFEIYTICVDKSREALDIFQLQHPLPWPVYWDGQGLQGAMCEQFGVDTAGMRFMLEPGLQRIVSTHLSPEGVAAALNLWIDQSQPPPLPGQEPPSQGFFHKFFGLKF